MSTARRQYAGVLGAAGLAGLCFAPVFGPAALATPVLAVCLTGLVVVEVCRRWPALVPWRPLLLAFGGLLAITQTVLFGTTVVGLPTVGTVQALGSGLSSWRRTLESTWPARPDPDLLLFVPLLVLAAGLPGVELLDRVGGLPALLPGLVVIGVAQAYDPLSGTPAYLVALGYAVLLALVVVPARPAPPRTTRRPGRNPVPLLGLAAMTLAGMAGGLLVVDLDPARRPPYTLQRVQDARLAAHRPANPLDELASRLARPDAEAFRYRTDAPVDRWRLLALEDFDGSNWTTDRPFLRLGDELAPADAVRVPTTSQRAELDVEALSGHWLPDQLLPRSVEGAGKVFVEPEGGTLLAADRPARYTLTWYTPRVSAPDLLNAAVDSRVRVGGVGQVPPRIAELADAAVGGKRATFQAALELERYLGTRYELATKGELPTGHGWPQLRRFLLDGHRGTSEQFAAAYVVLARLNGIPARLAVGFRAPASSDPDGWTTVRNQNVLVWPEVAVDGIGWWPLDPTGLADPSRERREQPDRVTEQARAGLPSTGELADPPPPKPDSRPDESGPSGGVRAPVGWVVGLLAVPLGWIAGVPLVRRIRALHRRRRPGVAAVVGAWAEARDRLRAYDVPVTSGMTVRDLAAAADLAELDRLADVVDAALWASNPATGLLVGEAWAAVDDVKQALRTRPWRERVRAALNVRSLLPP